MLDFTIRAHCQKLFTPNPIKKIKLKPEKDQQPYRNSLKKNKNWPQLKLIVHN